MQMRYIAVSHPGPPDVLELAVGPMPAVGDNDVLIEVAAAGVNRPDVFQRLGKYPPPPGASPILGLEVAGRISEVGRDVSQWKTGDAVCALVAGGGYAEYCAAPAVQCLPIPDSLSPVQAAAIPETCFTAGGSSPAKHCSSMAARVASARPRSSWPPRLERGSSRP